MRRQGPLVIVAPGYVQSGEPVFPVPNGGFIHRIDDESAWGVVVFGNGGVNTSYGFNNYKPAISAPNVGADGPAVSSLPFDDHQGPLIAPSFGGPFGDGPAGIDLRQVFVSLDYARKFGPVTIGIAPTIAVQILNIQGLQTLSPYSWDPYHLSNNGYDWSFGGGLAASGLEYSILPNLRLGLAGATPMWMTPFGKYAGAHRRPRPARRSGQRQRRPRLRRDAGSDADGRLEAYFLPRRSFASARRASRSTMASSGRSTGRALAGATPTWSSFGLEWRALKPLTLRLGYAYATPMIGGQDVTLNVLAPAISHNHVSGGFKYEIDKNQSIDFATVYAFKSTVSGPENQFFASFAYTVPAFPPLCPGATIPVTVPPALQPLHKDHRLAQRPRAQPELHLQVRQRQRPAPIAAKF